MKIAVYGLGLAGCTTAALLARQHEVWVTDPLPERVEAMGQGRSPVGDAAMEKLVADEGLHFKTAQDPTEAIREAELVILALPPQTEEGGTIRAEAIMEALWQVERDTPVVIRSTISLTFARKLLEAYADRTILYSPVFLRPESAMEDALHPDQIVIGLNYKTPGAARWAETVGKLFAACTDLPDVPVHRTGLRAAAASRLFADACLTLRTALLNEVDAFCEQNRVNAGDVLRIVLADKRLEKQAPRMGFGIVGEDLIKNTRQFLSELEGDESGDILYAALSANEKRQEYLLRQIFRAAKQREPAGEKMTIGWVADPGKEETEAKKAFFAQLEEEIRRRDMQLLVYAPGETGDGGADASTKCDLDHFKEAADLIVSDRVEEELRDVREKVYSRDKAFQKDFSLYPHHRLVQRAVKHVEDIETGPLRAVRGQMYLESLGKKLMEKLRLSEKKGVHFFLMNAHIGDMLKAISVIPLFRRYREEMGDPVNKAVVFVSKSHAGLAAAMPGVDEVIVLGDVEQEGLRRYVLLEKSIENVHIGGFNEQATRVLWGLPEDTFSRYGKLQLAPQPNPAAQDEAAAFFAERGIDPKKTVLLCPYAKTTSSLEYEWLREAIECFRRAGLTVLTNAVGEEKVFPNTERLDAPLDVLLEIIRLGPVVIGAQSGLLDAVNWMKVSDRYIRIHLATMHDTMPDWEFAEWMQVDAGLRIIVRTRKDRTDLSRKLIGAAGKYFPELLTAQEEIRKEASAAPYIIVQAGGEGRRMQGLTANKPKALVPVENRPLLFHLFQRFPESTFIIIADYKEDVLRRYLDCFAEAKYTVVSAAGRRGSAAGMAKALAEVPAETGFMITWSDLLFSEAYQAPETKTNAVGLSVDFPCRWSYRDGAFREERATQHGVAGVFYFSDKTILEDVPEEGSFVEYLSRKKLSLGEHLLTGVREIGTYEEWAKYPIPQCRPFNRLVFEEKTVVKEAIAQEGKWLQDKEKDWYALVQKAGYENIPRIHRFTPLTLERIHGRTLYECGACSTEQKKQILCNSVDALRRLHALRQAGADRQSYRTEYFDNTMLRLGRIKSLLPFSEKPRIRINSKRCRNVFYHEGQLRNALLRYFPDRFVLLHGDPTFSNILLRGDTEPVLIDPRGYFGGSGSFGDPAYDWGKLYYSLVGNYDQFNRKRFSLDIGQDAVDIHVESSGFEELEEYFLSLLDGEASREQLKLLLAVFYLRLTTYAWEDYDSLCGAFYLGTYYLEEAM